MRKGGCASVQAKSNAPFRAESSDACDKGIAANFPAFIRGAGHCGARKDIASKTKKGRAGLRGL
jgi:hypothetical protein